MIKPIWGSSRVVLLDSGFCVLKGIVALRKKSVFATALVKKHWYWSKYVKNEAIKENFSSKDVGTVAAMKGELDSVKVELHCLKEPNYTMTLMHFSYRDAVDSHISSRMFPIAMEKTLKTTRWSL